MHRLGTKDPRASALVVHGGRVYTSGQVGDIDKVKYRMRLPFYIVGS